MRYIIDTSIFITIPTLILCLLLTAAGVRDAEAEQTTKMVCRSGGNMSVIVSPSVNTRETWLQIRYIRSRFSLNSLKPKPGECTFINRTVSSEEPDILATHLRARIWTEFKAIGSRHANAGVVPSDMYKNDQEMAKRILDNVSNEGFFTLEVYDSGEGYFKIVSVSDGIQ